jgi:hypothetical protein
LRSLCTWCCALALAALGTATVGPRAAAAAAPGEAASRVEARSSDLVAVGLVHGDRMTIHLSRQIDNAPVRDAAVTLVLRGAAHPTTAETDGSYTLQTKDLTLPGAAAVEFQVTQAGLQESLKGTLQIAADAGQSENKNSARQLWWWVLNFAVCIGFLWLYSRRRKAAEDR